MRSLFTAVSLFVVSAGMDGTHKPSDKKPTAKPAAHPTVSRAKQQPRPRQNPFLQDSIRVASIATIMKSIAGRENEPAGTVFKNVLLFKDLPAKDFLKKMDEDYGRAVGAVCSSCHVPDEWDKDDKKNKIIARQMEKMVRVINGDHLARTEDLDEDYPKATCALCHRGTLHPPNTLPKPDRNTPPAEQRVNPPA